MRFNSQQIVSYCLGLHTQNPGPREVDLDPSPKRGSEKMNMLKQGRKTTEENKSYRTAWTHIQIRNSIAIIVISKCLIANRYQWKTQYLLEFSIFLTPTLLCLIKREVKLSFFKSFYPQQHLIMCAIGNSEKCQEKHRKWPKKQGKHYWKDGGTYEEMGETCGELSFTEISFTVSHQSLSQFIYKQSNTKIFENLHCFYLHKHFSV